MILLYTALFMLLAACGDDGDGDDSLWQGGSAVILAIIAAIIVWKVYKGRRAR